MSFSPSSVLLTRVCMCFSLRAWYSSSACCGSLISRRRRCMSLEATSLFRVQRPRVPAVLSWPLAFLGGGVIGVGLWYVAFRPLRSHPRSDMFVASLGAFIILTNVLLAAFGGLSRSYSITNSTSVVTAGLSLDRVAVAVACVVLMSAVAAFLRYTLTGKVISAVAQNPLRSRMCRGQLRSHSTPNALSR